MLMHRPQTPQLGFGSDYTLLQQFHPSFQNPRSAPGLEVPELTMFLIFYNDS